MDNTQEENVIEPVEQPLEPSVVDEEVATEEVVEETEVQDEPVEEAIEKKNEDEVPVEDALPQATGDRCPDCPLNAGLKDENTLCPTCKGYGFIQGE